MFKKLLITAALLTITTNTVFANGAPYIGLSIGERTNTNKYFNYRGIPGDLFVGYGANLGQGFYLAGELISTFATATINDNGLKSTWGVGISLIPGLMISEHTMAYFRLGYVRTQFQPKTTSNKTLNGGQLGFGLQTSLLQNWDLRGEYTYSNYSSLKGGGGNPSSDEFSLGLIYKFD